MGLRYILRGILVVKGYLPIFIAHAFRRTANTCRFALLIDVRRVHRAFFRRFPKAGIHRALLRFAGARIQVCKFIFIVSVSHGVLPIRASIRGTEPGTQVANRLSRLVDFCAGPGRDGAVLIGGASLQCRDAELYWTLLNVKRDSDARALLAEEYVGGEL